MKQTQTAVIEDLNMQELHSFVSEPFTHLVIHMPTLSYFCRNEMKSDDHCEGSTPNDGIVAMAVARKKFQASRWVMKWCGRGGV